MQEESSIHLLDHTERIEPEGQVVIKDVVVVVAGLLLLLLVRVAVGVLFKILVITVVVSQRSSQNFCHLNSNN